MTHSILRAQALTKVVRSGDDPLTILDGVSFDVDPGDTIAVVGASGSGKTTLLGLMAGLDQPTSGEVYIDGNALSTLDEDARAALRWLGHHGQPAVANLPLMPPGPSPLRTPRGWPARRRPAGCGGLLRAVRNPALPPARKT